MSDENQQYELPRQLLLLQQMMKVVGATRDALQPIDLQSFISSFSRNPSSEYAQRQFRDGVGLLDVAHELARECAQNCFLSVDIAKYNEDIRQNMAIFVKAYLEWLPETMPIAREQLENFLEETGFADISPPNSTILQVNNWVDEVFEKKYNPQQKEQAISAIKDILDYKLADIENIALLKERLLSKINGHYSKQPDPFHEFMQAFETFYINREIEYPFPLYRKLTSFNENEANALKDSTRWENTLYLRLGDNEITIAKPENTLFSPYKSILQQMLGGLAGYGQLAPSNKEIKNVLDAFFGIAAGTAGREFVGAIQIITTLCPEDSRTALLEQLGMGAVMEARLQRTMQQHPQQLYLMGELSEA